MKNAYTGNKSVKAGRRMGMHNHIIRKLSQATCDKVELNRRVLRLCKCFKEAEKALSCKKPEKDGKNQDKK